MTKEEVLEIASEYAQKKGYDIKQYDISIEFDKNEWRIEYQGKEPKPGNFFTIYVHDQTKSVSRLIPGK